MLGLGGGGVWKGLPILGGGWSLSFPTSPRLAGVRSVRLGAEAEEVKDISCLADCTGLINVPEH